MNGSSQQLTIPWYLRLIGLALFALILSRIEIRDIPMALAGVRLRFLPLAVASVYLVLILKACRWISLFRNQGLALGTKDAFKAYFYSIFLGVVTLGHVGDLTKAYFLKKYSGNGHKECFSLGEAGVSVILERFIEFGLYVSGGLFGLLLIEGGFKGQAGLFSYLTIGFIYLGLLFIIIFYRQGIWERLERMYRAKGESSDWLVRNLRGIFYGLSSYRGSDLVRPLWLTFLIWLAMALNYYFLACMFEISIPYGYFLFLYPLVSLAQALPITIAGFGTRELALIYCFSHFGVPTPEILAYSLVYFFTWLISLVVPGLYISLTSHFEEGMAK